MKRRTAIAAVFAAVAETVRQQRVSAQERDSTFIASTSRVADLDAYRHFTVSLDAKAGLKDITFTDGIESVTVTAAELMAALKSEAQHG